MPNNEGYKIAIKLNYAGKLKIDGEKMKLSRNNVITTQIVKQVDLRTKDYVVLQGEI